jgi:hypothetical protein
MREDMAASHAYSPDGIGESFPHLVTRKTAPFEGASLFGSRFDSGCRRATSGTVETQVRFPDCPHSEFMIVQFSLRMERTFKMPSAIENARKRLAVIRAEAAEIERFLALYESFSDEHIDANVSGTMGQSEETYPQNSKTVDNTKNTALSLRHGPRPPELVRIMERLIREVGRPMTRGEIVDALNRRDVEIPAKDKSRYLGTIAWRNKHTFIHIEGRGYWVRDAKMSVPDHPYSDPTDEISDELQT